MNGSHSKHSAGATSELGEGGVTLSGQGITTTMLILPQFYLTPGQA